MTSAGAGAQMTYVRVDDGGGEAGAVSPARERSDV